MITNILTEGNQRAAEKAGHKIQQHPRYQRHPNLNIKLINTYFSIHQSSPLLSCEIVEGDLIKFVNTCGRTFIWGPAFRCKEKSLD